MGRKGETGEEKERDREQRIGKKDEKSSEGGTGKIQ